MQYYNINNLLKIIQKINLGLKKSTVNGCQPAPRYIEIEQNGKSLLYSKLLAQVWSSRLLK